ncbi:efflux RND transporter periplasmic adaptor subunit [Asticcacaulis sp. SL142]|uniref:efflux RND transporter periplasmic adaptor subunit n=1 Tax=Asticcacaulis sp. SL142 TaxID=2995155 RepID=UPI00226C6933|nr:efflux RND transporter periplasmic adaptor subunit [Asticcacaulis sp. SL142]WAC46795.1 efflux RND transporter periplasmic adaptor subunit [Asticcacaulis sp. SL142]
MASKFFRKDNKALMIGLGVLVLVMAGWGLKAAFFSKPKAAPVISAPAQMGDIEKTVLATGSLEPYTLVSVGAQTSGRVTSLKVELGDQVKKGALIAEIDSATQNNALQTALANINNVRAQRAEGEARLAAAKLNYDRQATLYKADAGSKADFETAETEYKSAQASLKAIDAQIASAEVSRNTAEVNLGYTRITAPIDGTVLAIVTKEGQTINANQTTPTIVKMGQLDRMTIKAEISEADVINVREGMEVYFTTLGDSRRRYKATLRSIAPAPDSIKESDSVDTSTASNAIYYYGIFDVDNADGALRTFMTANVTIVLGSAKNVLTIPSTALGKPDRDGNYTVQVLGADEKITPRKITIGLNDGNNVEVKSGLKAGEKVVTAQAASGPSDTSQRMRRGPQGGL